MAEIDKQKEWIGFWKTAFFTTLGLLFALFGYMFQMYKKLEDIELIILNIVGVFSNSFDISF